MAGRRDKPLPSLEPTPGAVKLQCGEPPPRAVVCSGQQDLRCQVARQSSAVQAPCGMLRSQLSQEAPSSFIRRRSNIIAGYHLTPIGLLTGWRHWMSPRARCCVSCAGANRRRIAAGFGCRWRLPCCCMACSAGLSGIRCIPHLRLWLLPHRNSVMTPSKFALSHAARPWRCRHRPLPCQRSHRRSNSKSKRL